MHMGSEERKKPALGGEWLAVGIALGVAFGIIFGNIALWLPLGVCAGLAGPALKRIMNQDNNTNEPDKE